MTEIREERGSLIRACEAAAQTHIAYARRAHTEFQRSFHERRATEALQRAHKYRQELHHLPDDE
ncbi:hypothetical protein KBI52_09090 [Microvirga sp. HBU67558]|uniref:hypothetical protein n=1 Tax=Microvirga TaxID=186650 RepID=UPI001B375D0E|nr:MULTISPECIES: hypothetical protein [unclassified Microvirga]MBQ0820364.1 hypothetical protein [Microvirga sp. HBU67558]